MTNYSIEDSTTVRVSLPIGAGASWNNLCFAISPNNFFDNFTSLTYLSPSNYSPIITDYNKASTIKDYYYETEYYYSTNDYLPYINIYEAKNINNANFSINRQTLRVDVWTMTAGGYTSREIIPEGFCKEVKINNIVNYIENLKK